MKRTLRLLDMAVGQLFYEGQEPGLGWYFRDMLNADLLALVTTAGAHRKVHGYHRCVAKRFPHAIFYRVDGKTVVIHAVLDCRRDPQNIRRRLHEDRGAR